MDPSQRPSPPNDAARGFGALSGGEGDKRAAPHLRVSPWLIAVAVVVPTFMEVLDSTIANVALRYIAGSLSAASTDSEWIITSYLAANAVVLPISGWLSAHLGRRRYFLLSLTVFTIASGLCGIATSLEQLIAFRVLQGLAGGGLQPSSQGILLDTFPREKQGAAMTMFAIAALLAPIIGPTLGGYLTVNFDWRWIFYINLPIGAIAIVACGMLVHDPEYLKRETDDLRRRPINFDGIGLGLLVVAMCAWEVLLSKGREWDWLGDPFWRVHGLAAVLAVSVVGLVLHELRTPNPVIDFRPLASRHFAACCVIIFCAYGILYGTSTSLPALLQSLFGYDAYVSGLVMSPAGLFSILILVGVSVLISRGTDARWLIACGLAVMALGNFWMSRRSLAMGPWEVLGPRVVLIVGLSMIFAPLNVAAFLDTPARLRAAAVGLFALLRNEGGSVGTSLAQTAVISREQFHTVRLGEFLDPFNSTLRTFLEQGGQILTSLTGDPVNSQQMMLQVLANLRRQQALAMSFFDLFWLFSLVSAALILIVPLMKRSVAEKGAQIHLE